MAVETNEALLHQDVKGCGGRAWGPVSLFPPGYSPVALSLTHAHLPDGTMRTLKVSFDRCGHDGCLCACGYCCNQRLGVFAKMCGFGPAVDLDPGEKSVSSVKSINPTCRNFATPLATVPRKVLRPVGISTKVTPAWV